MKIVDTLTRLIGHFSSRFHYESLNKKNDDFGIEEANNWVQRYPLDPAIKGLNYLKIDAYAQSIIQGLKKVPITSSNLPLIQKHLIELAKQHDLLRQYLIKYLPKIDAERKTITSLKVDLICTYSS